MKPLLMFKSGDFDRAAPPPVRQAALRQDLELDPIVAAMAQGDELIALVSRAAMLAEVVDAGDILYRQAILRDALAQPQLLRELYTLAGEALTASKKSFFGLFSHYPSSIVFGATDAMELLVARLRKLRQLALEAQLTVASDGLQNFFAMLQRELPESYLEEIRQHLAHLRFRGGLLESAQLGPGLGLQCLVLRRRPGASGSWWMRLRDWFAARKRSEFTFRLPERDEAGARILSELRDRGLNEVANALAQSVDHVLLFFEQLRVEIAFYLGCLNLHRELAACAVPVSLPAPQPSTSGRLTFQDLRDLSLVLAKRQGVIGNDVCADNRSLLVVTGANQGGKSSFLRSVGQAQLMMQCGMFVAADHYSAALATGGVFTHFRREEDKTMRSGKFDEELARMRDVVASLQPNALILFNESFASTNEREGTQVASGIVRALLERNARVVFVTHMFALSQWFRAHHADQALFLRALRLPDGTRPFKLEEGQPEASSNALDLYAQVFGTTVAAIEQASRRDVLAEAETN